MDAPTLEYRVELAEKIKQNKMPFILLHETYVDALQDIFQHGILSKNERTRRRLQGYPSAFGGTLSGSFAYFMKLTSLYDLSSGTFLILDPKIMDKAKQSSEITNWYRVDVAIETEYIIAIVLAITGRKIFAGTSEYIPPNQVQDKFKDILSTMKKQIRFIENYIPIYLLNTDKNKCGKVFPAKV